MQLTFSCFTHRLLPPRPGPVNPDALALMARFPLVTVEKFQGPCGWRSDASPSCDQEAQIISVLKGVKAINPNVSTVFCTCTPADHFPTNWA
jgi:hypothetical protein